MLIFMEKAVEVYFIVQFDFFFVCCLKFYVIIDAKRLISCC